MEYSQRRILLGMLVSNGDCLLATVLAKQIKKDYPNSHLTWAISTLCHQLLENNPDVDSIWKIKVKSRESALNEDWYTFERIVMQKKLDGEFDEVFLTQIYPSNIHHYDGTTRGTIYGSYPFTVTVEARPVVRLVKEEIDKVFNYITKHRISEYKNVILVECSALSGQSFVTPEWALDVSLRLLGRVENLLVILSSHVPIHSDHPRIISAHDLTMRENAELTKYCSLLIGCSSGLTWISTSDWAKRLPMIQFLKRGKGFAFASVAYDHRYWKLDDSQIIETTNDNPARAVDLIQMALEKGIEITKPIFHQKLKPRFDSLLKYSFMFARKGKIRKSLQVVKNFIRRNYK